jgi:hypothetical protein
LQKNISKHSKTDQAAHRHICPWKAVSGRQSFAEGLRRAGPAPTREKFVTALETLRHFDFRGWVNYGPSERTGSNFIEITAIGSDGKFIH